MPLVPFALALVMVVAPPPTVRSTVRTVEAAFKAVSETSLRPSSPPRQRWGGPARRARLTGKPPSFSLVVLPCWNLGELRSIHRTTLDH